MFDRRLAVLPASAPIRRRRSGFTLVELLMVIGIVAMLLSILIPTINKARKRATEIVCASNLRQVHQALAMYVVDTRGMIFWRGEDLSLDGMEWYAFGGQDSGNTNTDQGGLFNRFVPRPLNPYAGGNVRIFQCPADNEPWPWSEGGPHWSWVGTSYNFNADGSLDTDPETDGLAGVKISKVRNSSATVVFLDASVVYPADWHKNGMGNVCFADGSVKYLALADVKTDAQYRWGP